MPCDNDKFRIPVSRSPYEVMGNSRYSGTEYSPNAETIDSVRRASVMMNSAYRNNGWLARAIDARTSSEIGSGITPKPVTGNADLDVQLSRLAQDVYSYCVAGGRSTVYTLQGQIVKSRLISGDGFIIIKHLKPSRSEHLPLPLMFQPLDSSFCPYELSTTSRQGNAIINGVEVDSIGSPVAYYFHRVDPAIANVNFKRISTGDLTGKFVRVLAKNVIHLNIASRVGQLRAIPEAIKALAKAIDFDKYQHSELDRKVIRSKISGVIERAEITEEDANFDPITGAKLNYNHSKLPEINLDSGTFVSLMAGEKLNLISSDDAGNGYSDYMRWQLHSIASPLNIPYQLLTGDFSSINDRLWRAIQNDFARNIEHITKLYTIPMVCVPMWQAMVDSAVKHGRIKVPEGMSKFDLYRASHMPQPFAHINPVQDIDAMYKSYLYGFKSRESIVAESTEELSIAELDERRAIDLESERSRGLPSVLDQQKANDVKATPPPPPQNKKGNIK